MVGTWLALTVSLTVFISGGAAAVLCFSVPGDQELQRLGAGAVGAMVVAAVVIGGALDVLMP